MKSAELTAYLSATESPSATLAWLRERLIPSVRDAFNNPSSARRLGLYLGDKLPDNERNLTDVRNRVSLIVEYDVARLINDLLHRARIEDMFVAHIVANRFPDLEIRNDSGKQGLRFEIKCLEAVAEEKSANFDTLKKDIDPDRDFLLVFLWGWEEERVSGTKWERAPQIIKVFAFHAASLSSLRDYYWLMNPPSDLGRGHQGFDLRHAVNCKRGRYHVEEGNCGKMLRMWGDADVLPSTSGALLRETRDMYVRFKNDVVRCGFDMISKKYLPKVSRGGGTVEAYAFKGRPLGWSLGRTAFIIRSEIVRPPRVPEASILLEGEIDQLLVFSDRYSWKEYRRSGERAVGGKEGNKPKYLPDQFAD